jgi:hypothetical protein
MTEQCPTSKETGALRYNSDWVEQQVKRLSGLAYNYTATGEFPNKDGFTAE